MVRAIGLDLRRLAAAGVGNDGDDGEDGGSGGDRVPDRVPQTVMVILELFLIDINEEYSNAGYGTASDKTMKVQR